MPARPGAFLTFEGIDGSGKTTQLRMLGERLTAAGYEVVCAQEPGGTRVGREIRRILLDAASTDLRPIPELLLYFASRAQNVEEVILPALEAGRIVISDRFNDASTAYQGYGRELGAEIIASLESLSCGGVRPDLTFLLDLDIETSVQRALRRGSDAPADETRFEREHLEFHRRVRRGYLEIQQREPERVRLIDASRTPEEIANEIGSITESLLQSR